MSMLGVELDLVKVLIHEGNYADLIDNFNCGIVYFNQFLEKSYKVYKDGLGVTRLIIDKKAHKIVGYYTLSCSAVLHIDGSETKSIPSIEITMFAIDSIYQDLLYKTEEPYVLSDYILWGIIAEIRDLSEIIGISYITLYAVKDAYKFYLRNGFFDFEQFMEPIYNKDVKGCIPMFINLTMVDN